MSHDRSEVESVKHASAACDPMSVGRICAVQRLRKEGAGAKGICPKGHEKNPSFSITRGPDGTIRGHCFSCGWNADYLGMWADSRGLDVERDFGEILVGAGSDVGITIDRRDGSGPREPRAPRAPLPPPAPLGPPPLSDELFHEVIAPVLWTGRLDRSGIALDVTNYLEDRAMLAPAREAGLAALPPPEYQGQIIRQLRDVHGDDVVARSGLVYAPEGEAPDWHAFVHANARLIIPWRAADGRVTTIQRRRLDGANPKYVFATGRQPRFPFGLEHLAAAPADATIAFCEGALDAIALRELARQEGTSVVVLGIPGVSAWSGERAARWAALARGRVAAVALDADGAGEKTADGMVRDLLAAGALSAATWTPTGAKDWAELLLAKHLKAVA